MDFDPHDFERTTRTESSKQLWFDDQRYMRAESRHARRGDPMLEQPNRPSKRGGSLRDFCEVVDTGTDLRRKVGSDENRVRDREMNKDTNSTSINT